jgi:DNA mismatch repair protein MutL
VIKESIGRHNLSPSLDFNNEGVVDIPVLKKNTEINAPRVSIDPGYNPFEEGRQGNRREWEEVRNHNIDNWETLFEEKGSNNPSMVNLETGEISTDQRNRFLQFKNRFILMSVKSGLMIIDQKRAHERVLFEKLIKADGQPAAGQKMLFPETIELNPSDFVTIEEIRDDLNRMGFDISAFGNHSVIVNAVPDTVKTSDLTATIEKILEDYRSSNSDVSLSKREKLAVSLAGNTAIGYGKILEQEEMRVLIDQLFACSNPNYSPSGKPVLTIMETDVIEKFLKAK